MDSALDGLITATVSRSRDAAIRSSTLTNFPLLITV